MLVKGGFCVDIYGCIFLEEYVTILKLSRFWKIVIVASIGDLDRLVVI